MPTSLRRLRSRARAGRRDSWRARPLQIALGQAGACVSGRERESWTLTDLAVTGEQRLGQVKDRAAIIPAHYDAAHFAMRRPDGTDIAPGSLTGSRPEAD